MTQAARKLLAAAHRIRIPVTSDKVTEELYGYRNFVVDTKAAKRRLTAYAKRCGVYPHQLDAEAWGEALCILDERHSARLNG